MSDKDVVMMDYFYRNTKFLDLTKIESQEQLQYWPAIGRPYKNHANRNLKVTTCVVELCDVMGYMIIIPFTEKWFKDHYTMTNNEINIGHCAESLRKRLEAESHRKMETDFQMVVGDNTRPDGSEILVFVEWKDPDLFRIFYQFLLDDAYRNLEI